MLILRDSNKLNYILKRLLSERKSKEIGGQELADMYGENTIKGVLISELCQKYKLTRLEAYGLIEHLVENGYIKDKITSNNRATIEITLSGTVFIRQGGYLIKLFYDIIILSFKAFSSIFFVFASVCGTYLGFQEFDNDKKERLELDSIKLSEKTLQREIQNLRQKITIFENCANASIQKKN